MMIRDKATFSLKGYKVLSVRFSSTSKAEHEIFMKEHSFKNQESDKPLGRTLFMVNIPPWATEESLKHVLNAYQIESVTFTKIVQEQKPSERSGFKCAYVVFTTEYELHQVLSTKTLIPFSSPEHEIPTGLLKWVKNYNKSVISEKEREAAAIEKIKKYDADEELRKRKDQTGEVNDEGWVTVTKKGRNPGISRKESVHNKIQEKLSRKEKVLKNFYRHQIREEKRDQLALLRKKAEEDKRKILALKQRRAFKPF